MVAVVRALKPTATIAASLRETWEKCPNSSHGPEARATILPRRSHKTSPISPRLRRRMRDCRWEWFCAA